MFNCPNCGKELAEGTAFCDNCGTAISAAPAAETVFCANCGTQTDASSEFCQNCGAALNAEAAPAPAKKKFPVKLAVIGAAAVAAIVLIVVILSAIFGTSKKDLALYLKDDEIWFSDFSKNGKFQVSSELYEDDGVSLRGYAVLSTDGKTLFYPDKIEHDGYTLYYRNITNAKKEAVKIDSGISQYVPNKKGTLVTYMKNGDLYQYDMKKGEKEKIAKEVDEWQYSDDGKIIYYVDVEGDLYVKQAGKDKVKMAADVYSIEGISKNAKTVYYLIEEEIPMKDDEGNVIEGSFEYEYDLYVQKMGKDKQAIEKDLSRDDRYDVRFYQDDEVVYFTKTETKKVNATTFVEDNVKNDAEASNSAKERAEEVWAVLKDAKVEVETKTLYYFDGKKVEKVVEDLNFVEASASDVPVRLVSAGGTYEKMELSSIWSAEEALEDVERYASWADKKDEVYSVVSGTAVTKLEVEEIYSATMSADGKLMYVITNVETERKAENQEGVAEGEDPIMEPIPYEEQEGDLVQVKIGKKAKLTVDEKYDAEIALAASYGFYGEDDDVFVYGKDFDVEKKTYDLFMDQKQVDSDVVSVLSYVKKALYYKTEVKKDDAGRVEGYTIKAYKGKKAVTIAEDVYSYQIMPSGQVLVLCDYNLDKGEGELFTVKVGKEKVKVDEDVSGLINFFYLEDVYK